MVTKIGKYWIFYRHFLYGSALGIGTVIGARNSLHEPIIQILLIAATLLMSASIFTSIVVNKYPEEFKNELKKRDINEF